CSTSCSRRRRKPRARNEPRRRSCPHPPRPERKLPPMPDPGGLSASMSAAERAIDRLMALHPKGFDLSLERISRLLERLGNPHEKLPPVIHIAGTNGKGSAAAFARALIEAS